MKGSSAASRRVLTLAIVTLALVSAAHASPRYRILYGFRGQPNDGAGAWGSLAFDARGDLYGTTINGGTYNLGTVFELTPHPGGRWTETILYDFDCYATPGCMPESGFVLDPAGNLYGATTGGGNEFGSVFELSSGGGWNLTVLYDRGTRSTLTLDEAGDLYGPMGSVGKYGDGAISELVKDDGWAENWLYSFCPKGYPCLDGAGPFGGVIWGPDGSLYGTTQWGGKNGYGEVFQLVPQEGGTWKEILLHSFPAFPTDGQTVYDGVIQDGSGNLYGATYEGGGGLHDCGVIFELSPQANGNWKETILYDFPNLSQGCSANDLTFDANGNLWGTSGGGGKYGDGVVFELSPQKSGKWKYSVVHQFNWKDGALPASAVIFDKQGNLYGTTVLGGAPYYNGIVFEITP